MSNSRAKKKTCFLSAPTNADLSVVRSALHQQGIDVVDTEELLHDLKIFDAVRKAITSADFVLAVFDPIQSSPSVLIECGIAVGQKKPILLLAAPDASIPFELSQFPTIRATTQNKAAIEFQIPQIANHLTTQFYNRSLKHPKKTNQFSRRLTDISGESVEDATRTLFTDFGFPVNSEVKNDKLRNIDLVVWVELLEQYAAKPIIAVEAKSDPKIATSDSAISQVKLLLQDADLYFGLIVYHGKSNTSNDLRIVGNSGKRAVFAVSLGSLRSLLLNDRFSRAIIDQWNKAVGTRG